LDVREALSAGVLYRKKYDNIGRLAHTAKRHIEESLPQNFKEKKLAPWKTRVAARRRFELAKAFELYDQTKVDYKETNFKPIFRGV
jgi:hypothetical protein